jgi:hypothetical protein
MSLNDFPTTAKLLEFKEKANIYPCHIGIHLPRIQVILILISESTGTASKDERPKAQRRPMRPSCKTRSAYAIIWAWADSVW